MFLSNWCWYALLSQVPMDKVNLQLAMNACTAQTDIEIAVRILRLNEELGFSACQALYESGLEVTSAASMSVLQLQMILVQ